MSEFSETGSSIPHDAITSTITKERVLNPNYLPSIQEVNQVFPYANGEYNNNWQEICTNPERPIFDLWTKEYINALSGYLEQRIKALGRTRENPITILEVAAGNGRLTHFINESLEQQRPGEYRIVATDKSGGGWDIKRDFPVEELDSGEAVKKYKPDIIICAWMPHNMDLSKDFREPTTSEYILIGEPDDGICGDSWQTYGLEPHIADQRDPKVNYEVDPPPYEKDGFTQNELEELSELQISRTGHSLTYSFKRN